MLESPQTLERHGDVRGLASGCSITSGDAIDAARRNPFSISRVSIEGFKLTQKNAVGEDKVCSWLIHLRGSFSNHGVAALRLSLMLRMFCTPGFSSHSEVHPLRHGQTPLRPSFQVARPQRTPQKRTPASRPARGLNERAVAPPAERNRNGLAVAAAACSKKLYSFCASVQECSGRNRGAFE